MNDDQLLLASAYVDDAVDDDERTRAEADADVMAEVDRMRALRDELRDVAAPNDARRQQALAAALAAFAADRAPGAHRPVPLARRPSRAWWGAAAASIVVVLAVGVALRDGGDGGGGDDAAGTVTEAVSEVVEDRATMSAAADTMSPAPSGPSDASSTGERDSDAEAPAVEATSAAPLATPPAVLTEPGDLARFAARADAGSAGGAAPAACPDPGGTSARPPTPESASKCSSTGTPSPPSTRAPAPSSNRWSGSRRYAAPTLRAMPGNPLTDPNWPADLADTVERVVGTVRQKATKPAVHVTRGIVFGLLGLFLGVTALTLLLIGATRGLQVLLDLFLTWERAVYVSYLLVGGILCLAGALFFRKRHTPDH